MGIGATSVQTKTCPCCAEEIDARAQWCAFCGAHFAVSSEGYCTACHRVSPADVVGRCATCGGELVDVRVESRLLEEPRQAAPAVPVTVVAPVAPKEEAPPARRRRSTIALWTLGILLLAVGAACFVAANHDNDLWRRTYASELRELKGDASAAAPRAAVLEARTNAVVRVADGYADSLESVVTAREAMVSGFNDAIDLSSDSATVAAVRTKLPPLIARYQRAVNAQKAKQAALAAAVAKLRKETP